MASYARHAIHHDAFNEHSLHTIMAQIKYQKPPAIIYETITLNGKPRNKYSPWRCIVWCDIGGDGKPIFDRNRDEFEAYWVKQGSLVWKPRGLMFVPDEPRDSVNVMSYIG